MCNMCTPLFAAYFASRTQGDQPDEGRRKLLRAGAFAAMAVMPGVSAFAQTGDEKADLIFFGGDIVTVNDRGPSAEAVAVADGKIIGVGPREKIEARFKGAGTSLIDLAGRTMIPGFVDAHSHIAQYEMTWGTPNLSPPPSATSRP